MRNRDLSSAFQWVRVSWLSGRSTVLDLASYCLLPMAALLGSRAVFLSAEEAAKERRRDYIASRGGRVVA